jgi:hypothetical protein
MNENEPPQWLSSEAVRQGIKFLLEYDRCLEEEIRLTRERCAMQEWMREEWDVNLRAQDTASKIAIVSMSIKSDLLSL